MTPPDHNTKGWPNTSDAELELLKQLWEQGSTTVRELHGRLEEAGHSWAYTTVQTMLTRLEEKGYVEVDRSGIAHSFRALVSRDSLLGRRLAELADKICDGAAAPLLLQLVSRNRFSADEIARLRRLLDGDEA